MLDVDRFAWLSFDVSAFPDAGMLSVSEVPAGPAKGSRVRGAPSPAPLG